MATADGRTPASDAVAHYESLLEQHGAVAPGVGWNSDFAQTERFAQLCEILPAEDAPISVLDFGCGFGSLAGFLAASRRLLCLAAASFASAEWSATASPARAGR